MIKSDFKLLQNTRFNQLSKFGETSQLLNRGFFIDWAFCKTPNKDLGCLSKTFKKQESYSFIRINSGTAVPVKPY